MTTLGAILLIIGLLGICGCSLCTTTAIRDADKWAAKGFQTQVAEYDLKMDGLLWGGFIWSHHAQAIVYKDNRMFYVCELGGLCQEPTFRAGRMTVLHEVDEYRKAIGR